MQRIGSCHWVADDGQGLSGSRHMPTRAEIDAEVATPTATLRKVGADLPAHRGNDARNVDRRRPDGIHHDHVLEPGRTREIGATARDLFREMLTKPRRRHELVGHPTMLSVAEFVTREPSLR